MPTSLSLPLPRRHVRAQVYEINTTALYTDTQREISTAMNLDGIVPNHSWTLALDDAPIRSRVHTIPLPPLSAHRRGVFFVEFIGNGVSLRAVVRKGSLQFLERLSIAGHVLRVVDEAKAAVDVTRVSVRMGGRRFTPVDATGDILIPFSTTGGSKEQDIVLTLEEEAGGGGAAAWSFSSLTSFTHMSENYNLDVSVFVNRYGSGCGGGRLAGVWWVPVSCLAGFWWCLAGVGRCVCLLPAAGHNAAAVHNICCVLEERATLTPCGRD